MSVSWQKRRPRSTDDAKDRTGDIIGSDEYAIFSYEPVLKRLQGIKEIPLIDEILFWTQDESAETSTIIASRAVSSIVSSIRTTLFRT